MEKTDRFSRENCWERFTKTGEVGAYLLYCAMKRTKSAGHE